MAALTSHCQNLEFITEPRSQGHIHVPLRNAKSRRLSATDRLNFMYYTCKSFLTKMVRINHIKLTVTLYLQSTITRVAKISQIMGTYAGWLVIFPDMYDTKSWSPRVSMQVPFQFWISTGRIYQTVQATNSACVPVDLLHSVISYRNNPRSRSRFRVTCHVS